MTDPREVAWAGGLFEGEGCIHRSLPGAKRVQRSLVLTSTDEDVVLRFQAAVGLGVVRKRGRGPSYLEHWKDSWEWHVGRWSSIVEVLTMFQPYLGVRRSAKAAEMLADPPWQPGSPRKSHCKRGHPLGGPGSDVRITPRGVRQCRVCVRDGLRARRDNVA